jgi:hypothetical protein
MADAHLTIHVRGQEVRIDRVADAGRDRLLRGRSPEEALRLIPLLHNLCPTAHRLAALLAMGRAPLPDDARLLAREILTEHALVMLRDWPVALGLTPDGAALRGLADLAPDRLAQLQRDLFGMPADPFLRIDAIGAVLPLAVPVSLCRTVLEWPVPAVLVGDDPTFFARCVDDPPIAARMAAAGGVTLGLRMLARLREAARLIVELTTDTFAPRFHTAAAGVGVVQAARGRLVHRVQVQDGVIRAYAIDTPTGAMAGAGGFLQQLLTTALAAPPALREKGLAIALSSADPCLPVQVEREAA